MDREKLFLDAVRENRDKMFRIAMSLLHVPADAEDAVSAAVLAGNWSVRIPVRMIQSAE